MAQPAVVSCWDEFASALKALMSNAEILLVRYDRMLLNPSFDQQAWIDIFDENKNFIKQFNVMLDRSGAFMEKGALFPVKEGDERAGLIAAFVVDMIKIGNAYLAMGDRV